MCELLGKAEAEATCRINRWLNRGRANSWLNLSGLGLTSMPACGIPPNCRRLNLSMNPLTSLEGLPEGLKHLEASYCDQLTEIIKLPDTLRHLVLDFTTNLAKIHTFPPNLIDISISESCFNNCPPFPNTLKIFRATYTQLSHVPCLPPNLLIFNVYNARLTVCPELPPRLKFCALEGNNIPESLIPDVYPESLQTFFCDYVEKEFNKIGVDITSSPGSVSE